MAWSVSVHPQLVNGEAAKEGPELLKVEELQGEDLQEGPVHDGAHVAHQKAWGA